MDNPYDLILQLAARLDSQEQLLQNLTAEVVASQAEIRTCAQNAAETDTYIWLLLCGALVMFMQTGFTLFEMGSCRAESAQTIMMKNLLDTSCSTIAWWAVGSGLAWEDVPNKGFSGTSGLFYTSAGFAARGGSAFWFFQWSFCMTACTIISGGVAERLNLGGYIFVTCLFASFAFPTVVAWTWSGNGWLNFVGAGYFDFAGSGVVHVTGGAGALAGAILLGPRQGRFQEGVDQEAFEAHNVSSVMMGTCILWFGWFGFNCGSTLAQDGTTHAMNPALGELAAQVAVNSVLAPASAGLAAVGLGLCRFGYWDTMSMCSAILAGLVSITAGCANVETHGAVIIGAIGGLFYCIASEALRRLKIDDPVDAFPVHCACGIWGVVAAVLFDRGIHDSNGFSPRGNATLAAALLANFVGVVAIFTWSVSIMCLFMGTLHYGHRYFNIAYRLIKASEHRGMDEAYFKQKEAYKFYRQSASSRLGERALTVPMPPVRENMGGSRAPPNETLSLAMTGRATDLQFIMAIAASIQRPEYTIREFFEDCLKAFPELSLFIPEQQNDDDVGTSTIQMAAVGTDPETEYQRTVGALFAVFWLLRLDIDGQHGFCYGLGDDWSVIRDSSEEQRQRFFKNMDWSKFTEVISLAGCTSAERIATMLVLTAFHDVMKISALCPEVQQEHGPYCGYEAGSVIHDHDVALAYVLDCYPDLLPSYRALPESERQLVLFTQGKIGFNHGWFVQGEAPPGAALTSLKASLAAAQGSRFAFYFFHWLTDLAGAEGTPMAGAEKFVLRFPLQVLHHFVWSASFLNELEHCSETVVMEDYLVARWRATLADQEVPSGYCSIALLRLAIMDQSAPHIMVSTFKDLPERTQTLLAEELARTGLAGQRYVRSPVSGGPAFLVYYGPALMQRTSEDIRKKQLALSALALIFQAGRELWPVTAEAEGEVITLEIGQLKTRDLEGVFGRDPSDARWVLRTHNAREASLEQHGRTALDQLDAKGVRYCYVTFRDLGPSDPANALMRL